jgi:hypothetical protein
MDINTLIQQFNLTHIDKSIQAYLDRIITSIKEAAESGSNILVYELIVLSIQDIQQIRNELLTLFPDMEVTIIDKRIYIDWS